MKNFFYLILAILIVSCVGNTKKGNGETYATKDRPGYCYHGDDGLWYIYYLNSTTGSYTYAGTSPSFTNYDSSETVAWTPTSENVSNFESVPETVADAMSESTGENAGGSEASEASDGGMSESSGSSEGGSDSSGGDSGGGDGGGDGGGGGE